MSDNLVHALAGAGGGIISMAITYPLITISSRLQVQRSHDSEAKYKGNFDAFKKILATEGVTGLFSGIESALFGAALTNGVYYYFFEATRKVLIKFSRHGSINTFESLISGSIAGAMTAIITNPIWVINTRLTVKDPNSKLSGSTLHELMQVIKTDGILSLWQGIGPALILVLNPVIQYSLFEQLKNYISKTRKLGNLDFFLLGALSKLIATSVTYPYIVVKSRMQMRQSKTDSSLRYDSISDGFSKILSTEGVKGLYKGIESKLTQSVLTAAILFMSKEALYKNTLILLSILSSRSKLRR
ncbi:Peroxisomal membrane protein PMP47A [Smittium mucronatum]|uniref:Peroxisomal membrane protein PMP47A n=1 Tax=Smittium mucronatum TaxID=133383 RepID=A0A1R0H147_9FUNG|nr:Peroxisomal membrane protein PMP47A [Smittium mucronatum]